MGSVGRFVARLRHFTFYGTALRWIAISRKHAAKNLVKNVRWIMYVYIDTFYVKTVHGSYDVNKNKMSKVWIGSIAIS